MENTNPVKAKLFKISSMTDLIRLVVSNSPNRGGYVYYAEKDGKHLYVVSHLIPGWYDLRGLPVTLTAETENAPETNFIAYRFPSEDEEESWEFVTNIQNSPKFAFIPIIRVDEFPDFII